MGLIGLASLLGPAPTTTTDSNLKRSHSQLGENNANDPEPSKKSKIWLYIINIFSHIININN